MQNGCKNPKEKTVYEENDPNTTARNVLLIELKIKCNIRILRNTIFLSPVLPKPEVSHVTSSSGVTEANCTAQSRPAAEIMWNVGGDNRTLGPAISSAYDQGDGTTIVTSTLLFQSGLLSDLSVKCIVHHRGLERPLTVALNPSGEELANVCSKPNPLC